MKTTQSLIILMLLIACLLPANVGSASSPGKQPAQQVSAYELIIAMNTLRASFGLPQLIEDPIINAVAQATAETMAANQSSWHIGDVSGRLQGSGFGGGSKVWATENFAVGGNHTIESIMEVWSDESHMYPAVNPAYCAVGAGVAKSPNGLTYYVLQAAYISGKSCGEYKSSSPGTGQTGGNTGVVPGVSQIVVPVKIATPDSAGKVFHEVASGQSLWAIAVAYKITINDLTTWNNIAKDVKLQIGQKLFIPGKDTAGYATPTPFGMILANTPDAAGQIIHVVQPYNTLSTIAQAYQVDMALLLALNGLQEDWPLQIGQKLVISGVQVTPSPTDLPLSPLQKLTPSEDGKYYHTVESGESLSWIAGLYETSTNNLMAWNGLSEDSILLPGQKLLLQVTPPATITPTPAPPTITSTAPAVPPSATASPTPTIKASLPTQPPAPPAGGGIPPIGIFILGIGGIALALGIIIKSKKQG